jgi:LacI family transcriptional regulator
VVKAGLPTVAALTRHVPEGAGWVNADNFQGIQDIVAHLVAQGHRRIAYAGPIYTSNFRDRQEGYRRALAANGLSWDSVLEFCQEDWSLLPYAETLDTWLGLPSPPTAILTANDGMAELILEMLQQRGVRVPDDVSVTGFDDILDARYIGGGLTTIHQPFRQIGETTVEQLIAIIQGKAGEECHTTLPAPLIVRMTTAPAKT